MNFYWLVVIFIRYDFFLDEERIFLFIRVHCYNFLHVQFIFTKFIKYIFEAYLILSMLSTTVSKNKVIIFIILLYLYENNNLLEIH